MEHTDFTKKILDNSKVKYIIKEDNLYVVGDEALQFANMFNKDTRRPLSKGVISPTEKEALPMMELLIKSVVRRSLLIKARSFIFLSRANPWMRNLTSSTTSKWLKGFLEDTGICPEAH